jgi:hypothetical protein
MENIDRISFIVILLKRNWFLKTCQCVLKQKMSFGAQVTTLIAIYIFLRLEILFKIGIVWKLWIVSLLF